MLSAEQAYHETKVSKLKRNMFLLKSSLTLEDGEFDSSTFAIQERKKPYFRLEHKHVDMTCSYDKLLAKFDACHEVAKISKSEAVVDFYKLGYLDCKSRVTLCHPIEDKDVELLYPEMPLLKMRILML